MAGAGFQVSFYTTVTVVQGILAVFLILRRPRSEVAWVLALLFAFNAMVSASFAREWAADRLVTSDGHARLYHLFDPPTSLLIAYLALIFPQPPMWLRTRPILRSSIWVVPLATWWLYAAPRRPDLFYGLPEHPFRLDFMFLTLMPVIGWVSVLVRVAMTGPRLHEAPLSRMNALVLAAFAIRAANIGILEPFSKFSYEPWVPGTTATIRGMLIVMHLVVLVWAVVHLLARRGRIAPAHRDAIDVLLLFLFLGVLEGFWTHAERINARATHVFSVFDVYVVRPALVWFAMSRHDFLAAPLRDARVSLAAMGGLAWVGFHFALASETFEPLPGSLVPIFRLVVPVLLGLAFLAVVRPFLVPSHPTGAGPPGADIESYTSRLRYLLDRDGRPGEDPILLSLRKRLGVTGEMHEELMRRLGHGANRPSRWLPGELVGGRYRIEHRLGEGGTGTIDLAVDASDGARVVLKRLRGLDDDACTLLLNEAAMAAKVGHPHILPLRAVERIEGEPVLVYPYAEGGSLKGRLVRDGPMPPDEAVETMRSILDALEAAHKAGIVHADVKPSNILLGKGGPWLADFGVARPMEAATALGDPTRTQVGGGTLRYMAPEQVQGLPATVRSDVYAAAVTLYEAIEGRTWIDDTLNDYETRKAIVEGHLAPFERMPDGLRKVLRKAGHVKVERRHGSASELGVALAATPLNDS